MDDARFDAWTRRRFGFGLTTGGLLASLVGLAAVADEAAAKRKRKKCKQNEKRCGKKCVKGDCCPGKPCGEPCDCRRTVGGATFCVALNIKVPCIECTSTADCQPPRRCVKDAFCGPDVTAICRPPCGFQP